MIIIHTNVDSFDSESIKFIEQVQVTLYLDPDRSKFLDPKDIVIDG